MPIGGCQTTGKIQETNLQEPVATGKTIIRIVLQNDIIVIDIVDDEYVGFDINFVYVE